MAASPVYTIGYGARDIDTFLALLREYQILYLIDVRTSPYSKYKPEFSKSSLQTRIEAENFKYVYMGDSLGGQPKDASFYTDGKVNYQILSQASFYRSGIDRLHQACRSGQRVALMCSEGKPEICHRSKLIGQTLSSEGLEVLHIDENGEILSQSEVLMRLTGGQPSLFGDDFLTFTSVKKYRDE